MMVKVIKVQAKASLALHESYHADLRENIRLTGTAVVATGALKDARLTESKLRILWACTGDDDGLPFVPSKFYIKGWNKKAAIRTRSVVYYAGWR